MIEIIDKVDCCGCNACGDICAQKAITFKNDEEGFGYPEINNELCTDCHLCEKICPIFNIKELKKNDDYSVKQFISSNKADLEKLRNSKYVQSDSQGFYKQVRDLLKAGEKVLVCGLPCQMAGLRSFLRIDYENL